MRERLPTRRVSDTASFFSERLGGRKLHVTRGYYPDGRVGELFVHGVKVGSDMDAIINDFATVSSIALQHGATVEEIANSLQRETTGKPGSVFGEIMDQIRGTR